MPEVTQKFNWKISGKRLLGKAEKFKHVRSNYKNLNGKSEGTGHCDNRRNVNMSEVIFRFLLENLSRRPLGQPEKCQHVRSDF